MNVINNQSNNIRIINNDRNIKAHSVAMISPSSLNNSNQGINAIQMFD